MLQDTHCKLMAAFGENGGGGGRGASDCGGVCGRCWGEQQTLYFMPFTPRCHSHHAHAYTSSQSLFTCAWNFNAALSLPGCVWKLMKMDVFEGFA